MDIIVMIFNMVINVATLLLALRFMMQLAAVDPYNPVVMSTIKATYVADVFGRILPTLAQGRLNLAALVLIALLQLVELFVFSSIGVIPHIAGVSFVIDSSLGLVAAVLLGLLSSFLTFCKWLIFGSIILSWVVVFTQSQSPYIGVVMQMTEPLLAPFRRIMPDLGPIDLSPMVAFLAIIICQHLLSAAAVTLLAMV
jgi:YggT family protein